MNSKKIGQNLAIAALGIGIILALVDNGAPTGGAEEQAAVSAAWTETVEQEGDHIKAVDLADRLMADAGDTVLVDVRPAYEFAAWHLPGAVNLSVPQVVGADGAALLDSSADKLVVLYSNGMVHPAQAWMELARRGHSNVRVLEGGLTEFKRDVLTPPSLRGPISEARAQTELPKFQAARAFFLGADPGSAVEAAVAAAAP